MTNFSQSKDGLIRNRDIFLHDGQHLRRVRLTVAMQAVIAAVFVAIIGWSSFATARMVSAPAGVSADMASLAAAAVTSSVSLLTESARRVGTAWPAPPVASKSKARNGLFRKCSKWIRQIPAALTAQINPKCTLKTPFIARS